MVKKEIIKRWRYGLFKCEMWESEIPDRRAMGRFKLGYRFWFDRKLVFEGEDFGSSPLYAIDSDKTMAALLSFLALRKGDTDAEYFEKYSPEQLEFSEQHGEELAMLAREMEEGAE